MSPVDQEFVQTIADMRRELNELQRGNQVYQGSWSTAPGRTFLQGNYYFEFDDTSINPLTIFAIGTRIRYRTNLSTTSYTYGFVVGYTFVGDIYQMYIFTEGMNDSTAFTPGTEIFLEFSTSSTPEGMSQVVGFLDENVVDSNGNAVTITSPSAFVVVDMAMIGGVLYCRVEGFSFTVTSTPDEIYVTLPVFPISGVTKSSGIVMSAGSSGGGASALARAYLTTNGGRIVIALKMNNTTWSGANNSIEGVTILGD